jgi:hypothetical protein
VLVKHLVERHKETLEALGKDFPTFRGLLERAERNREFDEQALAVSSGSGVEGEEGGDGKGKGRKRRAGGGEEEDEAYFNEDEEEEEDGAGERTGFPTASGGRPADALSACDVSQDGEDAFPGASTSAPSPAPSLPPLRLVNYDDDEEEDVDPFWLGKGAAAVRRGQQGLQEEKPGLGRGNGGGGGGAAARFGERKIVFNVLSTSLGKRVSEEEEEEEEEEREEEEGESRRRKAAASVIGDIFEDPSLMGGGQGEAGQASRTGAGTEVGRDGQGQEEHGEGPASEEGDEAGSGAIKKLKSGEGDSPGASRSSSVPAPSSPSSTSS